MNRLQKLQFIDIYLLISLISTGLFFMCCILTNGRIFNEVLNYFTDMQFNDYFIMEAFSSGLNHVYEIDRIDVCQPPLIYCLLFLVYKVVPVFVPDNKQWNVLTESNHQMTLFLMLNLIMVLVLVYALGQIFNKNSFKYNVLLPIAILFSYPMFGTSLQRGNVITFTMIFLLLAYAWIDSDNKLKSELSLIMISLATANKITPATCGWSLIKRRDWARVARLVIYGLLIFVIPFIFTGGLQGLRTYIENLTARSDIPVTYGSVKGMTTLILQIFGKRIPIISDQFAMIMGSIVQWIFLSLMLVGAWITKEKWREVLCIMGILAGFVSVNFSYVLIFLLPAFMMFLKKQEDQPKNNIADYISLICFSLIFTIPFYFMFSSWGVEGGCFLVMYFMLAVVVVDEIRMWICDHRRRVAND